MLLDSPARYGPVTRALHWGIAALLMWQWAGMALRGMLGRHPVSGFFVGLHQPVGAMLFLLVVLRVVWALANRRRRQHPGGGLVGRAARLGHRTLYAVMLAVPSLGLLRALGDARPFAPFGIVLNPGRAAPVEWMVAPANAVHGAMGWLLAVLVLGHVAMVAVHEGLWRDGTLARMAGSSP